MSKRALNTVLISVLLGAIGASCGDSSGDEPSVNVYTGFPADKKLSSFDDEDAKAACRSLSEDTSAQVPDSELLRARCVALAINQTAMISADKTKITLDVAACDSAAQQCQANPKSFGLEDTRDGDECNAAVANSPIMHCEATVAEYEACVSRILDQAKKGLASTTCANGETLIKTDGAGTRPDPDNIAECQLFLEKCPEVQVAI